ncbi:MAG: thymidylate kinase [Candidatus Sungbacteria bacterium]|nr:thymidylate kinase [Candidatus Sungbacteria bacterium]
MPKQNPFIIIEALDAGGSQTQTDLLSGRLKKEKYIVHQYHFPQEDTATGRLIYDKFLLRQNKQPFSRREQALLFIQDFFSKADEMHAIMGQAGKHIIVSDRFCTSTMAYQTVGKSGQDRKKMLDWINWICWQGKPVLPKPAKVIFLDTPVEVSLKRLKGKKLDFHETREKLATFRRSYTMLAKDQGWVVVKSMDGKRERTREEIHEEIFNHIKKIL